MHPTTNHTGITYSTYLQPRQPTTIPTTTTTPQRPLHLLIPLPSPALRPTCIPLRLTYRSSRTPTSITQSPLCVSMGNHTQTLLTGTPLLLPIALVHALAHRLWVRPDLRLSHAGIDVLVPSLLTLAALPPHPGHTPMPSSSQAAETLPQQWVASSYPVRLRPKVSQ